MGVDLSRFYGIDKEERDPYESSYFDPKKARHLRINNAMKFIRKPGGYQELYDRMCKTVKIIDADKLRINALLDDLESRDLKIWRYWKERGETDEMQALRNEFDIWVETHYGEDWADKYEHSDVMIQFLCELIENEFPLNENITEEPIEELAIVLPDNVVDELIKEQLIAEEIERRESSKLLPGGLGRVEIIANGPPVETTAIMAEHTRPLAIGNDSNEHLLNINAFPLVNRTMNAIFSEYVIKMGFKRVVLDVCLAVSLLVADMSGYYTNFYNSTQDSENFKPEETFVLSKFSKAETFDTKIYDTNEFLLFYRSTEQEDHNRYYAYGGRFIPDSPFERKENIEVPNQIPLNFEIQRRNTKNLTAIDLNGQEIIYTEVKPSNFTDSMDDVYPREEVALRYSSRIEGKDMGLFSAYLSALMSAIDMKSKVQFRTELTLQPGNRHINKIYGELHEAPPEISPEDQEKILGFSDIRRLFPILTTKYTSNVFRPIVYELISAMLYMGLPLKRRVHKEGISVIWDIGAIVRYFSLLPDRFTKFKALLKGVEEKRKNVHFAKYIKSDPIKRSFKQFIESEENTRAVISVLREFYNVTSDKVINEGIEEVRKLAYDMKVED